MSTLTQLRQRVYRRLGDRGYFAATSNPTVATTDEVDQEINNAIEHLNRTAERVGARLLAASASVFVVVDVPDQVITISGSPTGGTVTLDYLGRAVTINYNDDSAAVKTALDAGRTTGVTLSVSGDNPHTCNWPAGDRPNIPQITVTSNDLTGGTDPSAAVTGTASGSVPREVDLDHYLIQTASPFGPNWRWVDAIFRTENGNDTPVTWISYNDWRRREGGIFRFPHFYRGDEYVDGELVVRGDSSEEGLYLRGKNLGFARKPVQAMTLTVYYAPYVTDLSDATDTLTDIGLSQLESHSDAIATFAAWTIAANNGMSADSRLERRYGILERDFISQVRRIKGPASAPIRKRWSNRCATY